MAFSFDGVGSGLGEVVEGGLSLGFGLEACEVKRLWVNWRLVVRGEGGWIGDVVKGVVGGLGIRW